MAECEREPVPGTTKTVQRVNADEDGHSQVGQSATPPTLVDRVVCRAGDDSCATAHASTLNRATLSKPFRAEHTLLHLQRQYGNRYVERVLGLARQASNNDETKTGISSE